MPTHLSPAIQDPCEKLLSLLALQRSVLDELVALGPNQRKIVHSGNVEAIFDLLGKRQELIDRANELHAEVASEVAALERNSSAGVAMDSRGRQEIRRAMEEIEGALEKIMRCDDEDCEAILAFRDRSRAELTTLGRARQARSAYSLPSRKASGGSVEPRFSDKKG